ncbi:hypothetical protein GCM10022225_00380 [Plantactinospora mayteni]|uniref:Uncharacterized protein n=1 Tax=Plantactinospora mayteni TaxID=566021 RepID=A0ABQ4EYJ9_9ACTN|nr:hypothetical protein [Plantactinospora mayteni]GIG99734.1 hypothetical protein Pma05_63070 [Plantactinospora mayteni]
MNGIVDQPQTDEQTIAQHLDGRRCPECAPRGGCMRMLRIIRRRQEHADLLAAVTGVRHGPGRLVW